MTRRVAIAAIRRVGASTTEADQDLVAVESPLSLEVVQPATGVSRSLGLLMRTPGDDHDLVLGLLHSEGIVTHPDDVAEVVLAAAPDDQSPDSARVFLSPRVGLDPATAARALNATSACGLCGRVEMQAIARRRPPDAPPSPLDPAIIAALPARLREGQPVFGETGGLHAAAAFTASGERRVVREDVGRHNAVDKAIGALFQQHALPAHDALLVVSGRVAYEIVQKAAAAGFAAVVAVGAPSSLAVAAARAAGMTLIGFVRDGRFNVYVAGD